MIYDFQLQAIDVDPLTLRVDGQDIIEALGKAIAAFEEVHGIDPVALECHQVI